MWDAVFVFMLAGWLSIIFALVMRTIQSANEQKWKSRFYLILIMGLAVMGVVSCYLVWTLPGFT